MAPLSCESTVGEAFLAYVRIEYRSVLSADILASTRIIKRQEHLIYDHMSGRVLTLCGCEILR
jgi:hypothetical protein